MIRQPDEYRMETLVGQNANNNNLSYDEQMRIALEISKQDFSEQMQELEEQQILLIYQEQLKHREKQISGILVKYKKVARYDKEFKELLPMLENACDSYINGYTDSCYFDNESGEKLMKHFQQIRLNEEERNTILQVIKSETCGFPMTPPFAG
jgi:hypothetical protein